MWCYRLLSHPQKRKMLSEPCFGWVFYLFSFFSSWQMCLHNLSYISTDLNTVLGSVLFSHTVLGGFYSLWVGKGSRCVANFVLKYTQIILLLVTLYEFNLLFDIQYSRMLHTNTFGYGLILLAGIISLFGLAMLGERGLQSQPFQPFILLTFVWATMFMTSSKNLLTMFIAFEIMFFPSAYYVYKVGYTKPSTKSIVYLAVWTYVGSFLCLCGFAYMFAKAGTLELELLRTFTWSPIEKFYLGFLLLIGFGVKIPLWPFYYWLIKVHVDSPTGFSIFLSGFLVKTALYCLLHIFFLFNSQMLTLVTISWTMFGFLDASLRMWETVDIKKLVALATVQEMNAIFLLSIIFRNTSSPTVLCFIVLHGLLSTLLFLLVDYVYKIVGTRQATQAAGVVEFSPKTASGVWLALLTFRGLPVFAKFFVETELIAALVESVTGFLALVFLIATFVAVISFFRVWFSILYGVVKTKNSRGVYSGNIYLLVVAIALISGSVVLLLLYVSVFFIIKNCYEHPQLFGVYESRRKLTTLNFYISGFNLRYGKSFLLTKYL